MPLQLRSAKRRVPVPSRLAVLLLAMVASVPAGAQAPLSIPEKSHAALVSEMRRVWSAEPAPALPRWGRAVRAVERLVGLPWRAPAPIVLLVPDGGRGFACDGGDCAGRFESTRLILTTADRVDTLVVGVILLAESALLREDVWQHELTHALLAQHGLIDASRRHDARYFPERRAIALR